MSYSEDNGQVVLTMSREDYETLMIAFGCYSVVNLARGAEPADHFAMLDRINEGNPKYTPYQVKP